MIKANVCHTKPNRKLTTKLKPMNCSSSFHATLFGPIEKLVEFTSETLPV